MFFKRHKKAVPILILFLAVIIILSIKNGTSLISYLPVQEW